LLPVLQGTRRYAEAASKYGTGDVHTFARVADEIGVHIERGMVKAFPDEFSGCE